MFLNLIFKVKNIKCKESTRIWKRGTRSTEPHRKYQTWYNSTRFGNPELERRVRSGEWCAVAVARLHEILRENKKRKLYTGE